VPADRRSAVLSVMRDLGRAASVEEIAGALDVHPNTVRFHLRRLVEDGSAEQTVDTRAGRGRPRSLFRAVADRGGRNYLMLARMLAQTAAESGDAKLAERTGRSWGRQLLAEAGARPSKRPAKVAAHLETVLDSIGFAPRIEREGDGLRVDLRHCPFLEVAREQPGLVCGMHQALIQGVLNGLASGMQVENLKPFVEPSLCTARVVRHHV
jgi:predicted ArsR family transcriptional regulator